jgi:hypothetical protein
MKTIFALLNVFRRGSAVADPAVWKNRSALVMALSALIVALAQAAKGLGHDIGIDNDTASAIAGGIAAIAGLFNNFATSDKVGIPGLAPVPPEPARSDDPASDMPLGG